jgi:hypothetical protein
MTQNGGMSIKGRRPSNRTNGGFYIIEEGFVALTVCILGRKDIKVYSLSEVAFVDCFEGEWLTSDAT